MWGTADGLNVRDQMDKRRVVVTGLGMLSPIGNTVETSWENALAGVSGVASIDTFDTSAHSVKISAAVKNLDVAEYLDRKEARRMDEFIQYGLIAGIQAVEDAGLGDLDDVSRSRVGIAIGSGIGGIITITKTEGDLNRGGPRRVSPFFVPASVVNMLSGNLSMKYGFSGPNLAIVTACTTGAHNIGYGARTIQYGDADVMVVGGSEKATSPLTVAGFASMRALSTRNDDPQGASRPWDRDRDGFVLGDGAGVMVLESYEHASKRGANIYCELAGFGMSADAHHITSPPDDGAGAVASMQERHTRCRADERRHRLYQRPRHLYAPGGCGGNSCYQNRIRCRYARPGQFEQVDDRPPPRRGGRRGGNFHRALAAAPDDPSHDQPGAPRRGMRSRLRPRRGPRNVCQRGA